VLSTVATLKGMSELDPAHPLYRVVDELRGKAIALTDLTPPAPPYATRQDHEKAVRKAELVLMAEKAREQKLVEQSVTVAEEVDVLLQQLEAAVSPAEAGTEVVAAWTEQRKLSIRRALLELLYPLMQKEAFAALLTAAHATIVEDCSQRLREVAMAPAFRIAPAKRADVAVHKKKRRSAMWIPNAGEWYERRARTVGACLMTEDEVNLPGERKRMNNGEVVLVAVDENGEMLDRLRCRWLLTNIRVRRDARTNAHDLDNKTKELARLEQWLRDVRCEAIAVGACGLQCRRIKEELEHVAFAMALRASGEASAEQMADAYYRSSTPQAEEPLPIEHPGVQRQVFEQQMPLRAVLVDETIGALWAKTTAAQSEASELSLSMRTALSSARSLQDPYAETCHALAPDALELMQMPLHPLMPLLPEAPLRRSLTAELVDGACRLGVSVRDITSFDHRSQMLNYVPGLGPRKARQLLRTLQTNASKSKPIEERGKADDGVGLRPLLGRCVWHNAVAFLHFGVEKRSAEPGKPPGLDACRIHPEQYAQARKMCFDAMLDDDEEVDETEEKLEEAIEWAMSTPGMKYNPDGSAISALEELELEEFADHLREEGVRVGKETLEDIKTELLHPYCDNRGDCGARGPLESDRLFELLTSETEATLRPGCLVYVRYIRFEAGRQMGGSYQAGVMHVALQSGLTGTIAEDKISDQWDRVPSIETAGNDGRSMTIPQLPIAEGSTISMKVLQVDRHEFKVIGSCQGADLKSAVVGSLAEQERARDAERQRLEKARMYTKRRIGHPLFKNGTLQQVTTVLTAAPVGEVIFRPSSKGPAHLTATLKVTATGTLLHVDIAEENKPSAAELGATLFIGRVEAKGESGEAYDDLDEIVARYTEPLVENARELTGHRKFIDEPAFEKVEQSLQEEKRSAPASIPYRISPTQKYADYFLLAYLPKARLIKEYVHVTPAGFVYRKTTFNSVEQLLRWFKVHFKEPPPRP